MVYSLADPEVGIHRRDNKTEQNQKVSLDPRDSIEWENATLLIREQDLLLTSALGKTTEINSEVKTPQRTSHRIFQS